MKKCIKCNRTLALKNYSLDRRNKDGLVNTCKRCVADRDLRRNYGLSLADKKALEASQGGCCVICGNNWHSLQVDHDHRHCRRAISCGGCVRGLVCGPCNSGLGFFRDSPHLLRSAADYLERRGCAS